MCEYNPYENANPYNLKENERVGYYYDHSVDMTFYTKVTILKDFLPQTPLTVIYHN